MESDDGSPTPPVLSRPGSMAKARTVPDEEGLASFRKFRVMHEDPHGVRERLEKDPATPLGQGGENLLVHLARDAAPRLGLETNRPMGIADLYASLLKKGFDPGEAFHVLSRALQHEFMSAASRGQEMEIPGFLDRATR